VSIHAQVANILYRCKSVISDRIASLKLKDDVKCLLIKY